MKITEIQYSKYENKLKALQAEEPELNQAYKEAHALGDTRENSELDAARAKLESNTFEQSKIKNILEKAEIIGYDTSPVITVGSLVEIQSPSLETPLVLMISDSGDPIIEGVLNTNTPLAKKILGNVGSEVELNGNYFKVTKIVDPYSVSDIFNRFDSDTEVLDYHFRTLKIGEDDE